MPDFYPVPYAVPGFILLVLIAICAPLIVTVLGIGVNVLGNWALIYGHLGMPRLGLIGSGIASTITFLVMALVLAVAVLVLRPFRRTYLFGRFFRPDWQRLGEIVRIGTPICEDAWHVPVCEALSESGAEILFVPNGSPYYRGKFDRRIQTMLNRVIDRKSVV